MVKFSVYLNRRVFAMVTVAFPGYLCFCFHCVYVIYFLFLFDNQALSEIVRKLYECHDQVLLITKTYLYNFDPLKPHFYIVKLGFTGVYTSFLISAQNIDLVLVRTASTKRF